MKTQLKRLTTIIAGTMLLTASQFAQALVISDNYQGATGPDKDVVGDETVYGIQSADLKLLANDILSVSIKTNFAGKSGIYDIGSTVGNTGIGYGDLFLSSSWNPVGPAPYKTDDHSNGTIWTYGFSLDDRYNNVGGAGTLYSLNSGNNDADALLSNDFMTAGAYRTGQEVAVDTNGNVTSTGNGSWSVGADSINFLIDLSGTSLAGQNTFALHWGMTCANDVIEGSVRLPEPAILGLLALGLIGIGFSKRKKA